MSDLLLAVSEYGGTLALHSTILLGIAALLDLSGCIRADATRELLWRAALFGGFATAGIQVLWGIAPLGGSVAGSLPMVVPPAAEVSLVTLPGAGGAAASQLAGLDGVRLATAAWLALTLLGLLSLGASAYGLRRRLRLRPVPIELRARVRALATSLGVRAVRVAWSDRAATPLMLGLWRFELCIPERAHAELSAAEFEAVLVHELAHARARDPAWSLAAAIALRLAFWQPLAWVARRRLAALAELRCDDVARRSAPGAALGLSRALVCAAEWLRDRRAPAIPFGHAMATCRSGLGRRVHRLLNPPASSPLRPARPVLSLIAGALATAPVILPSAVPIPVAIALPASVPALPARLQTLAADIGGLRADFDSVRDLVLELELDGDATIAALLAQIEARLRRLESRLAGLAARRESSPFPGPSGPALPDLGATSR